MVEDFEEGFLCVVLLLFCLYLCLIHGVELSVLYRNKLDSEVCAWI